ncbi:MAG: hypothetical protein QM765_01660 [Myxococcales bacterium]
MIAALAAVLFAAAPVPFPERPPVEAWAGEDWSSDALAAVSKLPATKLGLTLQSNMIRPEAAAVLKQSPGSAVRLKPSGLVQAHVDMLHRLPQTTLVLPLAGPLEPALAEQLSKLGPQPLRLELHALLDSKTARSLAGLKNAEVVLDVGGRMPDQEELGLFLGLSRVKRVVRLRADDPPALVAALKTVRPSRLVVWAIEGARVGEAMLAALADANLPVRVAVDLRANADDLRRLAALPQISLELTLSKDSDTALPKARSLLDPLVSGP